VSVFLNHYDVARAVARFTAAQTPNRIRAALVLTELVNWTDDHSDGWAYWSKPRNASAKLAAMVVSTTWVANAEQEAADATDAELAAALRPVKAFLTRQAVPQAERDEILAPSTM